ncbi:MAG: BPL-N domain-containing protein [Candidatus Thorarchaeota archaeon]
MSKLAPILVLLITAMFLVSTINMSGQGEATDLSGVNVAVYEGGPTSWESRHALEYMFTWMNASVDVLTSTQIINGALDTYDVIVIPGGDAGDYNQDLGTAGRNQIRDFVKSGHGYVGMCAGAYFACDRIDWEGTPIQYSLDLFMGNAIGALDELAPWPGQAMCTIEIERENELIDLTDEPENHTVNYWGGPYFVPDNPNSIETLAKYTFNNEPAMIAFEYHEGRVFLSGPHPEFEEDSDRDDLIGYDAIFDDQGTEWNLMLSISLWLIEEVSDTPTHPDSPIFTFETVVVIGAATVFVLIAIVAIVRSIKS